MFLAGIRLFRIKFDLAELPEQFYLQYKFNNITDYLQI